MPGDQHSQPTLTSLSEGCIRVLGVTCHLHLQNDRGLLRATAVTRGWNGHRISVSTESGLWRSSSAAPAGIRTRNLSITSPALEPTSYPDSTEECRHAFSRVRRHDLAFAFGQLVAQLQCLRKSTFRHIFRQGIFYRLFHSSYRYADGVDRKWRRPLRLTQPQVRLQEIPSG